MEGTLVDLDVPVVSGKDLTEPQVEKTTPRTAEGTLVDLDSTEPVVVGQDSTTETEAFKTEVTEPPSKLCGYLNKRADRGLVKNFRQRWFVFEPRRCRLYYYKSSEDATALGSIDIAGASFSFDQGEQEGRAGQFEISSGDRTFVLQASDHSTMMSWLQELQLRRRHYSQLRTSMARTFSTSAMASASVLPPKSGLLKQQGTPQAQPSVQYQTVPPLVTIDETSRGVTTVNANVCLPSDNDSKHWSAETENKHSDHQGYTKVTTSQPPPSPTRSGVNRMSGFASSIKKKLSGNRTVNQTETGSVPHSQENLSTLQEKVETLEQELEANQKVIKILHEQLSSAQQEKRSSDHFVQAGSEKERLELVRQRDRQLAEVQKQLNETKMEKEDMRLDLKLSESSMQELKEQLLMFQEMLQAKDQVIIQLTHQVDDLEHGQTVPTGHSGDNNGPQTTQQQNNPVSTATWLDDTQNLKASFARFAFRLFRILCKCDSLEAFQTQNRFLNNEILQLNLLRNDDATREQLHLEKMSELEARYYQIKSKYLLLLNELHTPQRGGEENKTQEVISQLLDEAINVEGNEPVETPGRLQPLREEKFDRYGFSLEADLGEANPVVSRAGSLMRRSEEIQARSAEESISIAAVFLDVRRAFDTVWHDGLIYKLSRYGIKGPLNKWFSDYLVDRQQRVVINGIASTWGYTRAGVPQGSILGPLLFLVFINDINELPCSSNINCFADDTSLSNSGPTAQVVASTTNTDLQLVSTWFLDWGLQLHPDKCKVLCIKSPRSRVQLPPIYIAGQIVEEVPFYTHLGATIHQTLRWTKHVQTTSNKARRTLGFLWKLRDKLSREALEVAYNTMVRPKLEYAAVLFGDLPCSASKILERVQYQAGCLITGAPRRTPSSIVLQELEWDSLSTRRHFHSLILMYKLVKGLVPPHLQPLTPVTRGERTHVQLRNSGHLHLPRCRTQIYKSSFIPHASRLWNQLPQVVKEAPSLSTFKNSCKAHLLTQPRHQARRRNGPRLDNILAARRRMDQCVKWENYFANIGNRDLMRLPELKSLIRAGIPYEYRERIWNWCVRLRVQDSRTQADGAAPNQSHYQHLHITNRGKFNPAGKQIELDLMRTLPHNVHYASMESEGIQKLRRVLVAYSWHNPAIGYCQGLNRIVAIALLFMTEEDAFWCLVAIVEHIMPQDYFSKTLAGSQVDQRVFKDLLKEKLPHLSSHLDNNNVDLSLVTFNWFLTIFVDGIPTDTMLRIWDAFLYEGSKVLFRYALAFFKASEEAILQQKDYMSIFKFLRQMPQTMVDTRRLAQIAFHDLNPFPRRNINARRVFHKENVWAELRELDAIREDFTSSYEQRTTDFLSDDES
ncbi:TBC1D2B [Branchiostoma lanceolatum]|uniref:TBC1D2B protein n=1 Tax=Branchiostoma lanceolatum TaxID=7740 RepID=A0A8J9ZSB1_BRALA|nr:TBC1D2B [Branchiostoma lanceolatum]